MIEIVETFPIKTLLGRLFNNDKWQKCSYAYPILEHLSKIKKKTITNVEFIYTCKLMRKKIKKKQFDIFHNRCVDHCSVKETAYKFNLTPQRIREIIPYIIRKWWLPILEFGFSEKGGFKEHYNKTLRQHITNALQEHFDRLGTPPTNLYDMVLIEVEKPLLKTVMTHAKSNQSKAAVLLGLSRTTLIKKLARYGMLKCSDDVKE